MNPILGGCLGVIKYIIPFGILAVAYSVAREQGRFVKTKLFQVVLLLGFIASILTIFQISDGNINMSKGFENVVQAGYTLGLSNKGGGTIGAVIAFPLVSLFGKFGAAVVALRWSSSFISIFFWNKTIRNI